MGEGLCVCALIPRLAPRTPIIVVAHPQELEKPTNTGRFVAASLESARLVRRHELTSPPPPGSALLFPSDDATPLDPQTLGAPPTVLYVPDGTYRQARRMMKRDPYLSALPRVGLPKHVRAVGHIRTGLRPDHLSTYEAVARALGILEGPHLETPMRAFLAIVVGRTLFHRGKVASGSVPGGIPDRTP
jgi:DTW domain-containing protein YfiP